MTLTIQNIQKSYAETKVLHDVSLSIGEGEFVALLGPSGSGKTTLLNIIAGLNHADGGKLLWGGEDITQTKSGARKFGMVFQSYALFRHMSVAQNIAFGLRVLPRRERPTRGDIQDRVKELLEMVELPGLGNRYPGQLSGGQRQRVALARALAISPRLLLLDEPFSALDAQVRVTLRQSVRALQQKLQIGAILVTHDHSEAFSLADRIAVMDKGRITEFEPPAQLRHLPQFKGVA